MKENMKENMKASILKKGNKERGKSLVDGHLLIPNFFEGDFLDFFAKIISSRKRRRRGRRGGGTLEGSDFGRDDLKTLLHPGFVGDHFGGFVFFLSNSGQTTGDVPLAFPQSIELTRGGRRRRGRRAILKGSDFRRDDLKTLLQPGFVGDHFGGLVFFLSDSGQAMGDILLGLSQPMKFALRGRRKGGRTGGLSVESLELGRDEFKTIFQLGFFIV